MNKEEITKLTELRDRLNELSYKENEMKGDVSKVLECLFVPTMCLLLALVLLIIVKCITN